MTTISAEEALPILQQQAADRLILFRLHQACTQDIVNYIEKRTQQLERDLAEVAAAAQTRSYAQTSVITPEEEIEGEEDAEVDEEADSE